MDQKAIGAFLSACRKEKGWTQAQLAEQLGVTDKSISRWENGVTMPDLSLYEPLCKTLGIQISELLYARKIPPEELARFGEQSAMSLFKTKSQLMTFRIFTEILFTVGMLTAITTAHFLTTYSAPWFLCVLCGWFTAAFALFLRAKLTKAGMGPDRPGDPALADGTKPGV